MRTQQPVLRCILRHKGYSEYSRGVLPSARPGRAAVQLIGVLRSQGTLKSEIVQLERAHKRDSVDMEYLKNVVLKYMTRPWTRGEWDREYGVSAQRRGYHQRR